MTLHRIIPKGVQGMQVDATVPLAVNYLDEPRPNDPERTEFQKLFPGPYECPVCRDTNGATGWLTLQGFIDHIHEVHYCGSDVVIEEEILP